MLKTPATRPSVDDGVGRAQVMDKLEEYRDNWWCGKKRWLCEPVSDEDQPRELELDFPGGLSKSGQKRNLTRSSLLNPPELHDLASRFVCDKHPDDPRVPEALYLAVRSTRYGCSNEPTVKNSKQAYTILHSKYPKTKWAQMTKYWY